MTDDISTRSWSSTTDTGSGAYGSGSGDSGSGDTSTTDQVKATAGQVTEKAGQQIQDLRGRGREQVRSQIATRSDQAAEQVRNVVSSVTSVADDLEQKGSSGAANVVREIAQRGEKVADYLGGNDADRLLRDLENQARQRPWAVAAGSFVLGLAASRVLKASSQRRSQESLPGGTGGYGRSYAGSVGRQSYATPVVGAVDTGYSSSYPTGTTGESLPASGSIDVTTGVTGTESVPDAPQRGAW